MYMRRTAHQQLAKTLLAAGDPARLELLCAVFKNPDRCVSQLAMQTSGSVAITSHHLRALANAGLLQPVRTGKRICYKLRDNDLANDIKKLICKHL